ncbi:endonuclease [Qipengyuania sp. YG27]|uniref:Endonuclease n=1 Tax=Qipengyuania mesophila TaxID=2867246 RepID=A0ABS7JWX3_9SPHN|nr:endonuclease/exonuclease/phosphatase family protein [Qipengyuania mesophila]MBX7502159.1 endonuclease [Qipengyuania mesophila]
MTYNIKAQPWPLATGRADAVAAIGERLAAMRAAGRQPNIVLLQEAFTPQARSIAAAAGYRFMARGPTRAPDRGNTLLGADFAAASRWDRGEESAPVLDSGLLILSDYPIVRSESIAFPAGACAGFDCLASKGVMIAWVAVPGQGEPVAVVNTHLNSRNSTHVSVARADRAHVWQVAALRETVLQNISAGTSTIFGGDTNVGLVPSRQAVFDAHAPLGASSRDALKEALVGLKVDPGSLEEADGVVARNKDMIIFADGRSRHFEILDASVPFPVNGPDALSDHAGFVVRFQLSE